MINKINFLLTNPNNNTIHKLERAIREYSFLKESIRLGDLDWQCTFFKLYGMCNCKSFLDSQFFDSFFDFFKNVCVQKPMSQLLTELKKYLPKPSLEFVYTTKILNILNNAPIFDSHVQKALAIYYPKNFKFVKGHSLKACVFNYKLLCNWYSNTKYSNDRKRLIKLYDCYFSQLPQIPDVKKIDFMLWVLGS